MNPDEIKWHERVMTPVVPNEHNAGYYERRKYRP